MPDRDTVCYKKPFLKQVIARVDFVAPVRALLTTVPAKVGKARIYTLSNR